MKVSALWILCLVVGTALVMLPCFSCCSTATLSIPGLSFGSSTKMVETNRKLKQKVYNPVPESKSNHNVNLEDYHPIDPVPSSKASIKPGPIQHGVPLMPYIPKPSPPAPSHPRNGGIA
ncbi:hypothetical protein K2173_007987 [Erythroxylum novogranatense]|uniref:Uncharacterized protein n=1 Tax=Erythroxylum novogranatense TaxID=1862640 RepID=A0AAV8T8P3_9ROSI|nr:hypothetical protein K2173_007987 [Erythroxylum novogranatense]